MGTRKENLLWNVLLGSSVYLLDSLRNRMSSSVDDLGDRARDTYSEASRRVNRASDAIRGEDGHGFSTVATLLIGIGVGVGVGMLLAPASGEETRGTISNKVQEFSGRVKDKFAEGQPSGTAYGT